MIKVRGISFLINSSEGVEVVPRKTEVVNNCPRPLTPIYIRSFLGLAGHYQNFVDGFTSNASPLSTLTQKSKKFEWSEACDRGFQIIKDRLTSARLLSLPEPTKGSVVSCDASLVG